ncbi:MAG: TetR/AcrR family transcriptional regulator [Chloroflexota bacterium]|jgi:AcrR family transcriptional regulator
MTETLPSKGENTRKEILLAAYDLFVHQGYHGTSMRQIAEKAGIALGGIYNHYPSKEEIFHAVFLEFHPYHDFLPALAAVSGEDVEIFMRNAIYQIMTLLDKKPGFLQLMFIEAVEFNGIHIREIFQMVYPMGVNIAQSLQENNLKMRNIPPLLLMRLMIGFIFSFYLTDVLIAPASPQSFRENALDTFIDVYLHGIISNEPSKV